MHIRLLKTVSLYRVIKQGGVQMTYSEQAQTGKKEYAALKEASPEVMGCLVTVQG